MSDIGGLGINDFEMNQTYIQLQEMFSVFSTVLFSIIHFNNI